MLMNILSYPEFLKTLVSVVLAIISFFLDLGGHPMIPHGKEIDMSRFELTWCDEFDGGSLDMSKWNGHNFNDGQTSVRRGSYWDTALTSVENSNLHIATKYLENGLNGNGKPGWYTCGIDTRDRFTQKYGYFEVRCILPKGSGQWSAFWMFNGNISDEKCFGKNGAMGAEIDIFESPNYHREKKLEKNSVSSNIHIDGYGEAHQSINVCEAFIPANDPYEEYNTYGLEWNENEYIFYINGVETGRTSFGVSHEPEWLILSTEVGGQNAVPADDWAGEAINKPGNIITDFIVDYVRVYQYK